MEIVYYIRGYIRVWQIKNRTNQFSELARKNGFEKKNVKKNILRNIFLYIYNIYV